MNETITNAIARQQELVTTAQNENRSLTVEEIREFNSLQSEIDAAEPQARGADTSDGAGGTNNTGDGSDPHQERGAGATGNDESNSGGEDATRAYTPSAASEIVAMCRHFGYDAADYMQRGLTAEQIRADIISRQMSEHAPLSGRATVTADEGDKVRRAMSEGIMLRGGIPAADGNNSYRGMSFREITIEALERDDNKADYRHMDTDRLWSNACRAFLNPTSTFAAITDEAVQKSYIEGLKRAGASYDKFVRSGSLTDFKKTKNHEYLMSLGGMLDEVPENGELTAYVPKDVAMPERQLKTFGKQFTMTRQAFINDDIGLLTSMPMRYAIITQRTVNKAVYDILLGKKKLFDGKPLFDESRKNTLKKGTAVTLAAMKKMIYMLGIQKDAAGNQLALLPDVFIVPLGLGVDVQTILGSPTIHTADNQQSVNPYYGKNFEVVEDVTINGFISEKDPMPWFMGVKGEFVQVDYLNGKKEATIRRSEIPGVLGLVWDVFFDFGADVIFPEAVIRNPGVVTELED